MVEQWEHNCLMILGSRAGTKRWKMGGKVIPLPAVGLSHVALRRVELSVAAANHRPLRRRFAVHFGVAKTRRLAVRRRRDDDELAASATLHFALRSEIVPSKLFTLKILFSAKIKFESKFSSSSLKASLASEKCS
jgi:hypothetical protein